MADTPQALVALVVNGRFEEQDNLKDKMPPLKKGKGNYSHGSYAFSHHPLKFTHEKSFQFTVGTISACS